MIEVERGPFLHVLVGGTPPDGPILFRRNRLASFLAGEPSTAGVFWLYPAGVRTARRRNAQGGNGVPRLRALALPDLQGVVAAGLLHAPVLSGIVRMVSAFPAARKILWYTRPMYARLAELYAWDVVVYDCSDHWTAVDPSGNRLSRSVLRGWGRSEERIARRSDLVFATAAPLVERLRNEYGRDAKLVENGVDLVAFREVGPTPADIAELPRPRLGFVGAMKRQKIDFELLISLAREHPTWSLVLLGPARMSMDQDGAFGALLRLPNVHWLGSRPPADVPRYLQALDVGLLPYRAVPYNEGVFPLKFFEYLAAGLPVVGTSLPATVHHEEEGVYYHVRSDPDAFGAACREALAAGACRERRVARARQADWPSRFEAMLDDVKSELRRQSASFTTCGSGQHDGA